MVRSCWLLAFFAVACAANSDDSTGGGGTSSGGSGGTAGVAATGGSDDGGVVGGSSGFGGVDAGSDAAKGEPGPLLGSFQLTYYWVTTEEEFTGPKDTNLYDSSCTLLSTVASAFADSLAIEGTGRLSDGRVINTDGSCGCPTSPCYVEVDAAHPWGYGVQNKALVPYRSFAVDKDEIAYGTKLYVEELDGVSVPGDAPWGGFVHDGCVSADDTGGAIIGKHVDWFVALKASYSALDGQLGLSSVTVHEGGTRCP